ncbi:MAG: DUF4919 domain-containing protein [Rhizomicrobium sp.]|jgi:hypothetical protein
MRQSVRYVRIALTLALSLALPFVLPLGLCGAALAEAPPISADTPSIAPSAALYAKLVEKARNGDADTNYTALRLSYVQSEGYDPYSTRTRPLFEDIWQALNAKDCSGAIAKSNELLRIDFTRIVIHALRSDCFGRLGDAANASRELAIGRGLAASLLASGDGKTPSTAYVVVTLNEEGFVLHELGVTEEQQALVNDNGHEYDRIAGTDKAGKKTSVYFEVSNLFAGLSREFGTSKEH